jgi:hypothetical protein
MQIVHKIPIWKSVFPSGYKNDLTFIVYGYNTGGHTDL